MQDEWKKLKATIQAVGTLVLMGAGLLFVALPESHESQSDSASGWVKKLNSNLLSIEPIAAHELPPEDIHEVALSCDMEAIDLPLTASHVRFKIPVCPNVEVLSVTNETNQLKGELFYQESGLAISELIGLIPGSNNFSFVVKTKKSDRAPASTKTLRLFRRPRSEENG